MNLLHLSDHHGGAASLRCLLEPYRGEHPDLVLVTGDMIGHFTKMGPPWLDPFYEGAQQSKEWEAMVDVINEIFEGVEIVSTTGNHDFCDYAIEGSVKSFDTACPTMIEVHGLKIAGFTGVSYIAGRWRNELDDRSVRLMLEVLAEVGKEADILMTHTGPHGILDFASKSTRAQEHIGFKGMWSVIRNFPNLKLHVFGHTHEAAGTMRRGNVLFSNASCTVNKIVI